MQTEEMAVFDGGTKESRAAGPTSRDVSSCFVVAGYTASPNAQRGREVYWGSGG